MANEATTSFETAAKRAQEYPEDVPNGDRRVIAVIENGLEMIAKGPNGAVILSDVAEETCEDYVVI